mmetsp:Transcript_13846/g.44292  ORF Transcript_13846/g.44292 Transcript_13846/m.44292 type:complete len:142 (-) Transcript_13846:520-945(-)
MSEVNLTNARRLRAKDTLDFRQLGPREYMVRLPVQGGLGLSLGWTADRTVVVAGFLDLADGTWGPAEACGHICRHDKVVKANGAALEGLSLAEVSCLLRKSGEFLELELRRPLPTPPLPQPPKVRRRSVPVAPASSFALTA